MHVPIGLVWLMIILRMRVSNVWIGLHSPDLNPIEHAWDALKRRINARLAQPQTAQQFANYLVEEWVRIPRKDIKTLVLSFWTRCTEVIDARGGHTRY